MQKVCLTEYLSIDLLKPIV